MLNRVSFILFILVPVLFAQDTSQTFLSLKQTGVEKFITDNPAYDGRGTIVFVLDTGVDPGIEGLLSTPTGETKIVDVRDFSGEGDIQLFEAAVKDDRITAGLSSGEISLSGAGTLALKPTDGKYYLGCFSEERLSNSSAAIKDINSNGKNNDVFAAVVFKTKEGAEEFWVAYFDTDGDGSLSGEKPLRNYSEKFDTFKIPNASRIPYLTFAVNIFPEQKMLSLFYDDGSHGTHVSGIAAGYQISKQKQFNGVAPGAKLIALKIGDNTLSGGATVTGSMKKAFLYADGLSRKFKEPCVINMSFGISSVIEGNSEIEAFLNDLLKKNQYLYVCISNGNSGPGISSAGLPACSKYVFSSGAVLPKEVGRDVYGASALESDVILQFSSRGAEVSKPDAVSPGACVSTVPNFSGSDKMWGTSMASPYSAGVMALLLSAASQEFPDVKIPSQMLFRAVKAGAVHMEGATALDEGSGYINVPNAWEILKKWILKKEYENFQNYNVTAYAPNMPGERAQNLYIRNGLMLSPTDAFSFFITRANAMMTEKFNRVYKIKSDSPWLSAVQNKVYIRNQQPASVTVRINRSKMTEPGLYSSKIKAVRQGDDFPEFEMTAAIVIPFEFNSANNFEFSRSNVSLKPAGWIRYFINIPAGAGALKIRLNPSKEAYADVLFRLFDNDGQRVAVSPSLSTASGREAVRQNFYNLKPGVYEVVVSANHMAKETSAFSIQAELSGLSFSSSALQGKGKNIEISNVFGHELQAEVNGKILGYCKNQDIIIQNAKFTYDFTLRKNEVSRELKISIQKDDFNKLTDFAIIVTNQSEPGTIKPVIAKTSLENETGSILVFNPDDKQDSVKLRLKLSPAFAGEPVDLSANVKEETIVKEQSGLAFSNLTDSKVNVYPGCSKQIIFRDIKIPFNVPPGNVPFGKILFKSVSDGKNEYEIPFTLD